MMFGRRRIVAFGREHMNFGRGAYVTYTNARILAKAYGQYRTAQDRECFDSAGTEIPWYTYPAIEYIKNHDLRSLNILEYGSGNSSIFYLSRGAAVTSVEDNYSWYEKISRDSEILGHNYVFADLQNDYVDRPEVLDADIVAIDGSWRTESVAFVMSKILSGESVPSWVIFDNSDRYPISIRKLDEELGWPRVDFCGFGPINAYTWVTSIYLNPDRRIPRNDSHIASVHGIVCNMEQEAT